MNEQQAKDALIVALDGSYADCLRVAQELQGQARWAKVGMTLFYSQGASFIKQLKDMGFKVFLDLKMHDIPHQVQGAVHSLMDLQVDMLTLHTLGGLEMMTQAQASVRKACEDSGVQLPITLGVTILTSMNEESLQQVGVGEELESEVLKLAQLSKQAGLTGVVASPLEARKLRELLGSKSAIVTPGVRPLGSATGDQKRVTTPSQALSWGASHIVVGRPITQAADPMGVFSDIVSEICVNYQS